ncbi:peptidoglycan DD-metalloendopeptidase family protein [Streptomyces sp. NPDC057428]|uniref:M23 family metallopeptidase n=1 Tax=Streptomyces sp. NPDC057428 TaxID=3346129 RepID=UPI00367AD2B7
MPANGKHRRKKSRPLSRGILAAGAGGAVLALPLIGATGAHAAEPAAPAAKSAAVTPGAPAAKHSPKTYTVVSGDYLAKIATAKKIKGGWQKLYKDNRDVIGDNPSLIVPGMKLTLGAKASGTAEKPATAKHAASEAKPATKAEPAAEKAAPAGGKAATADSGASQSNASGWSAPVENPTVTTQYHVAGASWSSGYHTGSDFQAASGTSVRSIGPGTVVSAGWGGAYGNEIVIQHSDGMYSQYAHLSSLEVSAGQTVTGGQEIGLSGSTGNSTGPHLHFEVRTGPSYGSDVDPIAYLRSHGVSI